MPQVVYLVRHGESEWNVLRRTQGQVAHPRLTDTGRAQARAAAQVVAGDLAGRGAALDLIVTSDLTRAVESAAILAETVGCDVVADRRLRERDLGDLQGVSYDISWSVAAELDWTDIDLAPHGGESERQVRTRMAAALDAHPDGVVALVTHGDSIRALLAHLADPGGPLLEWVDIPNGAVARVTDGGRVAWLSPAQR